MSTAIYIKIASRAIRTSSTIDCHQEPFSFPSGYSESPTPASAEGARFGVCSRTISVLVYYAVQIAILSKTSVCIDTLS